MKPILRIINGIQCNYMQVVVVNEFKVLTVDNFGSGPVRYTILASKRNLELGDGE